jgi:hypothetical protein
MGLQQGFAMGEMGFRVSLQRGNPEPLMSALGQKQTLRRLDPMSALPPQKRTSPDTVAMSALGQKRT